MSSQSQLVNDPFAKKSRGNEGGKRRGTAYICDPSQRTFFPAFSEHRQPAGRLFAGHRFVMAEGRFEANDETLGGFARLRCSFTHGDRYTIQFWFYQEHGNDVLNGEIPSSVQQEED